MRLWRERHTSGFADHRRLFRRGADAECRASVSTGDGLAYTNAERNLNKMLTKRQIERQDFVDNKIFEFLQEFLPPSKEMKWDIEVIGAVRDVIQDQIVDKQKAMSAGQFYPYIKI